MIGWISPEELKEWADALRDVHPRHPPVGKLPWTDAHVEPCELCMIINSMRKRVREELADRFVRAEKMSQQIKEESAEWSRQMNAGQ